jgi:endoglucanase
VEAVRQSGGNNETRYLVLPGYVTNHRYPVGPSFILPNDTARDRLIVTFHFYDPYEFGIQGSRYSWGTASEKLRVDNAFSPFKERFIDRNIQVIIGECGAVLQTYPGNPARDAEARQSRRDYLSCIFGTAKKYGLVPIYWDNGAISGNGEKFGLLDRRTGQPNSEESDALIKLMINAVK